MNELLVEKVLRAVESIPAGEAASYGQIATIVGTVPRVVGAIMARYGTFVPWWRVVNVQGKLPPDLAQQARSHWEEEDFTVLADDSGVDLRRDGTDLDELAARYRDAARALAAVAEDE